MTLRPRFACNGRSAVLTAVLAGAGIGYLPLVVTRPALAEGRLVQVLPEWRSQEALFHMAFTSRRYMLPAVRTFVDFFASRLGQRFSDWQGAERATNAA